MTDLDSTLDPFDAMFDVGDISGSKSGGSSKGGSGNSNESDNTLRSSNRAHLLELISEGPCVGLANGGTSIYLDGTPVVNESGSANFRGVQWAIRTGTPDQPAIAGNSQVETPFAVGVKVKQATGGVVRTIVDNNVNRVRVVVQVDALARTKSDGSITTNSVQWQVQVRPHNGAWALAAQVDLIEQKTTSPYQQASMVDLPAGGAPWDIQVVRLTPDSQKIEDQSDTTWISYTEIVAGSFTYPNSAMVYLDIDASLFDQSSVPSRSFDWVGLIIQVPSNYDPVKRTYAGLWDGTFKNAWTNNPAWIFYDLVTNNRYGLGEFVSADAVDKWSLYQIAQYCDQPVPDGFNGTEPRYVFNGCINTRDEAYRVLQSITTTWRGMAFWSLGQVFATIDAPADAVKLVTPANVIGGHFNYSGTGLKARHSVALVTWNDPDDMYRPAVEVVVNNDMLQQFGWRETTLSAVGCTTRSSAHRYGKWLLDTEQYETETVTYQASWDHATVKPGDLIAIADPNKAGTRTGGRLVGLDARGQTAYLDQPFVPAPGQSYGFLAEGPEGGIQARTIVGFNEDGSVVLNAPLNPQPAPNALWIITGGDVNRRKYRVIAVKEHEKHIFEITALFHDPNKYARVEQGIFFDPIQYYRPKTTIKAPTNFKADQSLYQIDGHYASRILLSWTPGDDFQSKAYHLQANTPKGQVDYGIINTPSFDVENTSYGTYSFALVAIGLAGQVSPVVTVSIEVTGWLANGGPYVSGLEIVGQGADTTFSGRNVSIDWVNNFPNSGIDIAQDRIAGAGTRNPFYRDNIVSVLDTKGNVIRQDYGQTDLYTYTYEMNAADNAPFGRGAQREFTFAVQVRNTVGYTSEPDNLTVQNPVPDMVVPNVIGGLDSVFVIYSAPADRDFAGVLIWMEESPTFDPWSTRPKYDGPNTAINIKADNLKTYYVRMACYDGFGKDGLNVCPPIEVFTGSRLFDVEPPAVPTGLSLTAQPITMATGEVVNSLLATWDPSPSENYAYFSVEIREHVEGGSDGAGNTGNWIAANVDKPTYSWTNLIAGQAYDVQVRAFSIAGFPSGYAISGNFTMPKKTTPPGNPTGFVVLPSLKSLFLQWSNPGDSDLAYVEVYQGTKRDFTTATLVGKSAGQGFTIAGLTSGDALSFWIRAVNTSGVGSGFVGPVDGTPGLALTADIADLAISGTKISDDAISTPKIQANAITTKLIAAGAVVANPIAAGVITGDKIVGGTITGDLISVSTALPATITVGKTGVTIGDTAAPAALINSQTTSIQPGKILIGGSTYLSDWRNGSDFTKIEGGAIAANTITANKLTIGSRGITVSDLQFDYDKTTNVVKWTAGAITYTAADGTTQTVQITAGSFQWNSTGWQYPCAYIGWKEGATVLTASMDVKDVTGAAFIQLATYRGFNSLVATYGRTVIDGANIVTGSIKAEQLFVGKLITNAIQVDSGIIQNVHLAGNITFDRMAGGTLYSTDSIRVGGDRFVISSVNQNITIRDTQAFNDGSGFPGRPRVILGNLGGGQYGLAMYDGSGMLIMSTAGLLSIDKVTGVGALAKQNTVDVSQTSGFGTLARQNTADRSQTTGFGTLSAQNSVDYTQMTGVSIWATVNQLNSGNIGNLVAAGGISGTFISDLTAAKITSGTVTARMQAASGSFDAFDERTGQLRCRMGLQPGVDYGLFLWDYNGQNILNSSGVTGTFIRDLTVGTSKLGDNAVSVLASTFSGGNASDIYCGFSTDVPATVLITFAGTAQVASGGTAYGNMYMDGGGLYSAVLVTATGSAITVPMNMTYIKSVDPGNHTARVLITGGGASVIPGNLSLTVTVLKK